MAKILVVDDQAYIRQLVSETLIDDGHAVVTAKDAAASRKQLDKVQPDLVILDLYLDGPEGIRLFEVFREKVPDVSVIIFTAYDSYRRDKRLRETDGYVLKSLDFTELRKQVSRALATKRTAP